ncbi:MAG: phosphoribosyltransferase family protein [Candidatus Buchananbacteria bacterium]
MNQKVLELLLFKDHFIAGKMNSPRVGHFPFLADARKIFCRIEILDVVAEELAGIIGPWDVDLIASPEAAGVPFGVATALKVKKNFLYLRKEPKGYQTNNLIEGDFTPGQRVVIVDDFISKGGGKEKYVKVLEAAGLVVVGVAVFNDAHYGPKYLEEQKWLRENKKYKFTTLVTWPELMDYAAEQKFFSQEFCEIVKDWLDDPIEWQTKDENWQKFKGVAIKEKNLNFHPSFEEI